MTEHQPGEPPGYRHPATSYEWAKLIHRGSGPKLPLKLQPVAWALCDRARLENGRFIAFPSLDTLAGDIGIARRSVMRLLADLELTGWVRRAPGDPRKRIATRYTLVIPEAAELGTEESLVAPAELGTEQSLETEESLGFAPVDGDPTLGTDGAELGTERSLPRDRAVTTLGTEWSPEGPIEGPNEEPIEGPLSSHVSNARAGASNPTTPKPQPAATPLYANAVARNRLPDAFPDLLGRRGQPLAHMHGITEADGRRILDDYSRSHAEQTPSAFVAYLHDLNRTAATATPGEPWRTPVPAADTSPADTATAELRGPGNGTAAATAAESGMGDGEDSDTGSSTESAVLGRVISAAHSPVDGPQSAEGTRDAPTAGESLPGAQSVDRGSGETGGRAGRGGRGSTTPEERLQRALALMHTMTEASQAAAMQRGRTRVQKYLDAGPQTEGQIRDRFKGSTFLTRTDGKVNAPLLVPVFLADLVELGQITQLHDGRYQLAADARRSV